MGLKRDAAKKESEGSPSIEEPVNTDTWRCAVVMAVERSALDSFVLKEFMEEASNGRRREVALINYEHFVLKMIDYFVNGELPYHYAFLLKFRPMFQEAAECVKSKYPIPVDLLVKIVKALLFLFREVSLKKIEARNSGPQDPVAAMAERPFVVAAVSPPPPPPPPKANPPKAPATGKARNQGAEAPVRVRPPSITKEDTKLLKRGEGAKESQCIDDAPADGFFQMYVLLTGFYQPDFPVELVKAQVPLHGLLCIDTSLTGVKRIVSSTYGRLQKKAVLPKTSEIRRFWDDFLKTLWNPEFTGYFREVVFQVYSPQKLLCERKQLREFIYKEISYLMYDLSDYKRQHVHYLRNMKLWDVDGDPRGSRTRGSETDEGEKEGARRETRSLEPAESFLEDVATECVSVPVVLARMLDVLCGREEEGGADRRPSSFDSIDSDEESASVPSRPRVSQSVVSNQGSSAGTPLWSQIVFDSGDVNAFAVYARTKSLDVRYHLSGTSLEDSWSSRETLLPGEGSGDTCFETRPNKSVGENLEEALSPKNGIFGSYWRKMRSGHDVERGGLGGAPIDYRLYAFLISKMRCRQPPRNALAVASGPSLRTLGNAGSLLQKRSFFELLTDSESEMRKPHFTVTECSRSVLRCIPYNLKNVNRSFFCPREFKVVAPEKLKASSAPDLGPRPLLINEMSFISDLNVPEDVLTRVEWTVYGDLEAAFAGRDSNGFDFVEELNKTKLLAKEKEFWEEFNCVDYDYSALTDSLFVVIHNRKDSQNTYHEVFNNRLRTGIGLRDFFEYVLEDESQWIASQEKLRQKKLSFMARKATENDSADSYTDSDFWAVNSIKQRESLRSGGGAGMAAVPAPGKEVDEVPEPGPESAAARGEPPETSDASPATFHSFEGYDVGNLAVQFSGLKAVYFAEDSTMTVELVERLYGDQDLAVRVRQGGHTLHLHSYVCPEPHVIEPYTFHLTHRNGVVMAFGRRRTGNADEDCRVPVSGSGGAAWEQESLEGSGNEVRGEYDENATKFATYDLKLSLPNGLVVEVLRDGRRRTQVRQRFLGRRFTGTRKVMRGNEKCRIFLYDGSLVKILRDGTFQVLKANASIVSATTGDLTVESMSGSLRTTSESAFASASNEKTRPESVERTSPLDNYNMITSGGSVVVVSGGTVTASKALDMFQNSDLESGQKFFRRADGTNYMIEEGGRLVIEFEDGTKMSHTPIAGDRERDFVESDDNSESDHEHHPADLADGEPDPGWVFIDEELVFEHPDYATVIHNSETETWQVLLPWDSRVSVNEGGDYTVHLDGRTKLEINGDFIGMRRLSTEGRLACAASVDLTVFRKNDAAAAYCRMENSQGETFIVEASSNSYVLSPEEMKLDWEKENGKLKKEEEEAKEEKKGGQLEVPFQFEVHSGIVKKEEEQKQEEEEEEELCENAENKNESGAKNPELTKEKKYFVVRKDVTGFELVHNEDLEKTLARLAEGSVVHTRQFGNTRCIVVVGPQPRRKPRTEMWRIDSMLPDARFEAGARTRKTSSTYGSPPSWVHPFPKRKTKFQVPQRLTCRVFVETRNTDYSPGSGRLECRYCDMPEVSEADAVLENAAALGIRSYAKMFAEDDRSLLEAAYLCAARQIVDERKNAKPRGGEKLERCLDLLARAIELQKYHKRAIRHHEVPNYFHHPEGLCWLALDQLLGSIKLTAVSGRKLDTRSAPRSSPPESESTFSREEVEYNLEWSPDKSYSDLSCFTNASYKTAPAAVGRVAEPGYGVAVPRNAVSVPAVHLKDSTVPDDVALLLGKGVCSLGEEDFAQAPSDVALEDLLRLGLL